MKIKNTIICLLNYMIYFWFKSKILKLLNQKLKRYIKPKSILITKLSFLKNAEEIIYNI